MNKREENPRCKHCVIERDRRSFVGQPNVDQISYRCRLMTEGDVISCRKVADRIMQMWIAVPGNICCPFAPSQAWVKCPFYEPETD